MKRRDAEKLLGGYAMGILTETERRSLFEAALEHQEVFDALMDEEALRELLADPAARQRLLVVLSEAGPAAKVRPFWRKPAVLGLAASLFLVVTTSLMLRRQPTEALHTRLPEAAKAEPEQAANLAAKETSAEAPGIAKPQAPKTGGAVSRTVVPQASKQAPVPAEGLQESYTSTMAKAAPPADQEKGLQAAESPAMAAAAPSPVMAKRAKAASGLSDSSRPQANRAETKVEEADAMGAGPVPTPFSHTLQRLSDGRYRLAVTWEGDGHVYLVRRATAAASEIPATSTKAKARQRTAVFEFTLEPGQVLDLFLRAQPEPDPLALPPSEDGRGRWQRIIPGSEGL